MYRIGLTGSIGTGKSTVLGWLKEWGAVSLDGDVLARRVVEKGCPLLEEIASRFGRDMITADGELDRAKMGALVFRDKAVRAAYNEIMHPAIWQEFEKELAQLEQQGCACVVLDIPLLLELGWQDRVQEVWVVFVPEEVQKERLMKRNGYTKEEAEQRIRSQMPAAEKRKHAQVVIDNSGTLEETKRQVRAAWETVQMNKGERCE